ncbi:hepcidin [Alexandromys fortis]|uniref:hepcidin n=1 Tax=Alexandromys fortis TaxID=100897 RepID=UPI002152D914|nr:hepcidin [Microtus fortis]
MAQNAKIQAACLLLLLSASLASSAFLQQLARQPDALQPGHRAEGRADETLLAPTRTKRDTYLPVCVFCCRCCNNRSCGICCKT